MKEETKSTLDALMSKKDDANRASEVRAQETRLEIETFLAEFKDVRNRVIRPAMEEVSQYLKAHGHGCMIEEREEEMDPKKGQRSAEIRMYVSPNDRVSTLPGNSPAVGFISKLYGEKIILQVSTVQSGRGGSSGPKGEYSLEQLTSDSVEKMIADAVTDIFK